MSVTFQDQTLDDTREDRGFGAAGEPNGGLWAATPDAFLLHVAIEHMAQGLLMLDASQRVTVVNRKFLELYSLPALIKPGATAYDIVEHSVLVGNYGPVTVEDAWKAASQRLAAKAPWRLKQRLPTGPVIDIAYAPMPGGGWVTTHLDVTVRQVAEDRLAYLAHYDSLTALANRALVLERLTADLEAGVSFALLLIDLDRFKNVNDSLGHACGDDLLRQVGARIVSQAPAGAFVARLGGDEFLLQLPVPGLPDQARAAARTQAALLIDALCRPFTLSGHRAQIGASIGIAFAPGDGRTHDSLMHCADLALYQAKSQGRGTARAYGEHLVRAAGMDQPDRRVPRDLLRGTGVHQSCELGCE